MKKRFRITYEVVTDESANHGDFAHHGFLPKSKEIPIHRNNFPKNTTLFTLKDAMELIFDARIHVCEADSSHITEGNPPRWITAQITSDQDRPSLSLSVHLDRSCSDSSAYRIAKLFKVYGTK